MQVTIAENGQIALDMLEKHAFDGILMDCQMPVLDGYEATKKICAQSRFKDLPILVMTVNAMVDDKEKVIACGMNDHIGNPIRIQELFSIMGKWIVPSKAVTGDFRKSKSAPQIDLSTLLPTITVVDIQTGLNTCQGDGKLCLKLLKSFLKNESQFVERFNNELNLGNKKDAHRMAHTLKGVAGNIGATNIQKVAASLEAMCNEYANDPSLAAEALLVHTKLEPVIKTLALMNFDELFELVDSVSGSIDTNEASEIDLESEIEKLKEYIEGFSTEAGDQLKIIKQPLKKLKDPMLVSNIDKAFEALDFDEALELLKSLQG